MKKNSEDMKELPFDSLPAHQRPGFRFYIFLPLPALPILPNLQLGPA